jgi:hypothetical protein
VIAITPVLERGACHARLSTGADLSIWVSLHVIRFKTMIFATEAAGISSVNIVDKSAAERP